MGAGFDNASSRYLLNSTTPVTAVPITMAAWVYPTQAATGRRIIEIADGSTNNNMFYIGQGGADFEFGVAAGAGTEDTQFLGVVTANAWHFLLARFISITNRRWQVLNADGSVSLGSDATSRTPGSIDRMVIGAEGGSGLGGAAFDGYVAEYWLANADVQPDGGVMQEALLRQLAYGGPFSLPHIMPSIIEYRSFRSGLATDTDSQGEVYFGSKGVQRWTNTNGVYLAPHPPLPYWYAKPAADPRLILV